MSLSACVYVALIAVMLVAHWQVGNRHPWAWLLAIAARLGTIVWASSTGATALVPVAAAFIVVEWRNYRKARKERALADRVAAFIAADPNETQ